MPLPCGPSQRPALIVVIIAANNKLLLVLLRRVKAARPRMGLRPPQVRHICFDVEPVCAARRNGHGGNVAC